MCLFSFSVYLYHYRSSGNYKLQKNMLGCLNDLYLKLHYSSDIKAHNNYSNSVKNIKRVTYLSGIIDNIIRGRAIWIFLGRYRYIGHSWTDSRYFQYF